jgi:hypothetical protein
VQSTNAQALLATSSNSTFSTLPPTATGAVISNVATSNIGTTVATISWTTDQPSTTQVAYGATTAYGTWSVMNSTLVTSHVITLTGLTSGTIYNFMALSNVSSGASAQSANGSFKTISLPVGAGPVVSSVAFWGISGSGITISWATDQFSD